MKKLLVIAVAALTLAACTQERNIVPADPGLTTLTASHASTRSALWASDGESLYNILWDAPDNIMVGYAGTELATFTSTNESPAAEATFTGKLPEGSGTLYGIYPVDSSNSIDANGVFSIAFKDVQTAVAGSYDPTAFPAVAQSDSKDLSFQNVCGLLELTVGYDDVTKISLSGAVVDEYDVLTRAASMVPLPGGILTGEFGPDGLELTEYSEDLYEIVLNAPEGGFFSPEDTYYMAVPPCNLSSGVTFTLTRESGNPVKVVIRGSVSVERSKVHKVKNLYIEPELPEEPAADNRISYDGGETWHPLKSAGFYYDDYLDGYDFFLLGEERTEFSRITSVPSCDWFGIDLAGSKLGEYTLPSDLDVANGGDDNFGWFGYMSWLGAPVGSTHEDLNWISFSEVDNGTLSIAISSDKSTLDLEVTAEFDGSSVIVIYHGPLIESDDYIWGFYI